MNASRFVVGLALVACGGCAWVPDHGQYQDDRGTIDPAVRATFAPGTTTRADVLCELGEPDWISDDEARIAYRSRLIESWFFIYMVGGLGVQVVALNPQPLASHEKFARKHDFPFPVASDAGGEVCKRYGARGLLGVTKRALVLVGRDGRVKWRRSDFPLFHQTTEDVRKAIAGLLS